jgi:nitroreductase
MKTQTLSDNITLRTIYERRSVRRYKDISIDHDTITRLLDAGRMAPSAMNKQPWNFIFLPKKIPSKHSQKK